ncbi:hypothetical protein ScPMuIL_012844 [Solemya velum]
MTPPVSPWSTQFEEDFHHSPPKRPNLEVEVPAFPLLFQCAGELRVVNNELKKEGYLKSGYLERFLKEPDCLYSEFSSTLCELFDYSFISHLALVEQMEELFMFLRKSISVIQSGISSRPLVFSTQAKSSNELLDVRMQVKVFLEYVNIFLLKHCPQANQINSDVYHLFHFHLDTYWSVLQILHTITTKFPDFTYTHKLTECSVDDMETSVFSQTVQIILWDLVALANQKFSKSFWVSTHHVIQGITLLEDQGEGQQQQEELDSDVFVNPPPISISSGTGFSLWLMMHVAPLLGYDVRGHYSNQVSLPSNYFDVQTLLKKYLTKNNTSENELRSYLQCCMTFSKIWESNTSLLVLLWDYFYRRLNNNFQITNTGGVFGIPSISKSSLGLLDMCKKWSTNTSDGAEKENSFQLFLRLLSSSLSCSLKGSNREWKQMKGRFYSKFHQRRMQELTETGLYNFTCLFLTLALTADLEDVSSKICDFYDMLDLSCLATGKRSVIWKGAFALMMVHVEKSLDIGFLAEKMARSFLVVCREFSDTVLESSGRHGLWKLIILYLDSVQDLFDSSNALTHSQHKLIVFQNLFSGCKQNELQKVLTVIQSIITRCRLVHTETLHGYDAVSPTQNKELAEVLVNESYSFVKEHVTTLTPPSILADVAAGLSLLMMEYSIRVGKEDYNSSFWFFGSGENVNANISCRYLSQLLSEDSVMEKMSAQPAHQVQLVQSWFRCAVYLPSNSLQLTSVNSVMVKIEEVVKVFQQMGLDISNSIDTAHIQFIKALGRQYSTTQNWMERIQLRDKVMQFFSEVPKHISPIVRSLGPSEALHAAYSVSGQLVKHCAPLLFVQSKLDCPLPKIIDMMVVPHIMFNPDKPASSAFLSAIRDTLHLFVQGLSKLDYKKVPYVQRRLKDIVTIYLQKFPLKSCGSLGIGAAVHVHPLVTALNESFGKHSSPEACQFRQFTLQQVHEQFLAVKNFSLPSNHMVGLSYLTEVLQRTVSSEIIARDSETIMPVVLEYLLLSDSSTIQQHTTTMLQHLLQACKKHTALVPR